jgi:phosphoglycolate phosphatase-like HAD superfamily hydrolase
LFNKVLKENGISQISWQDYRKKHLGNSDPEFFASVLGIEPDTKEANEMTQRKEEYFKQEQDKLEPFPGVIEFVTKSAEKWTLAIATKASQQEVEPFLEKEHIKEKLKAIIVLGELKEGSRIRSIFYML